MPADVRGFVRDLIARKTAADVRTKVRGRAIVKGGPGTAARTTGLLSGILTYAVQEGYRDNNPANGVRRPADGKRKARLDDEGYRKLGEILRQAEAKGESWQAVEAIRFAVLTGCRRGEVAALRRAELDFPGRALRLADTKTGESIRPLSAIAADRASRALARHRGRVRVPERPPARARSR